MLSLLDEIKKIDPAQSPNGLGGFLDQMESYASDSEFSEDPGSAKAFAELVDSWFEKFSTQIKGSADLERRFKELAIRLRWGAPFSLDSNWKKEMLSFYLVSAIKKGLEPASTIAKWLEFHEFGAEPETKMRAEAIYDLTSNNELIGASKIEVSNLGSVPSTVQNWLKDYLASLPQNAPADNFNKLQYLTNSQNVKKLNESEKQILSQVIDIYKLLKNPRSIDRVNVSSIKIPVPPSRRSVSSQPVSSVPAAKETTTFEKRLAQVSAPAAPAHGVDLEVFKHRVEDVKDTPKVKPIEPKPKVNLTPDEIKREVKTTELPPHTQSRPKIVPPSVGGSKSIPPAPAPAISKPMTKPISRTIMPPRIAIADVRTLEDLKKIDVGNLTQGPVTKQISEIYIKIISLIKQNKVLPFYAVAAFEQSPLFQTYLSHGRAKVAGIAEANDLTQEEFEAIADLRKQIERL